MDQLEKEWKEGSLKLYPHQFEGVEYMEKWLENGHGGINAMDMGLGKTCQTVVLLSRLSSKQQGPFLILAPLSVCNHWAEELRRFSMGTLDPIKFTGYELERQKMLQEDIKLNNVFITAPHIFIKESTIEYLKKQQKKLPFTLVAIDEAQCVKNQNTQLAKSIREATNNTNTKFILLTGTPIQNDLSELYSLLSFADSNEFPISGVDSFVKKYTDQTKLENLKETLSKYMIRRTKDEVFSKEMEKCEQVVLYHGISQIQKQLYKNIISKNSQVFQDKNNVKLTNILMQLRKCVIHPYMFQGFSFCCYKNLLGIEPEPFEEGEHLVEASGKIQVLDRLLKYCRFRGHRCLLFSQFIGALDIVEDFLRMRKWSYERLDGTCRAEERTEKISYFQQSKEAPFCFLLSTKAGGVGLTLTAADTVIFLDSDWNPQNDLQAMARCHRIGQTKTVRVIRLVTRYTVDQYVVAKARDKLKLTDDIMGTNDSQLQAADVVEVLRNQFGLLMEAETETFKCSDEELESFVGKTVGNEWQSLEKNVLLNSDECDVQDVDKNDYCTFEGVSYRTGKAEEWDRLMEESAVENKENKKRKREYRLMKDESMSPPRKRKRQTKEEIWAKKGYKSTNLKEPEGDEEDDENQDDAPLKYVFGDVTKLGKYATGKDLILHSVDNGGEFGTGGVFNAIRSLDSGIAESYEKAGKMKDLLIGDAHLCPVASSSNSQLQVALLVVQSSKNRRVMKAETLESCLRRVSHFAKHEGYTIHTPRLGKGCDISWYMIDRLLKKHFSLRGINCFVYYHPPNRRSQSPQSDEEMECNQQEETKEPKKAQTPEKKFEGSLQKKAKTPSPTKSGRPKRRTEKSKIIEETVDDEDEESEESSDESSASENNWTDSEEESDEDDEEEELDDEEEGKKNTQRIYFSELSVDDLASPAKPVNFYIPKMGIKKSLVVDMVESEEEDQDGPSMKTVVEKSQKEKETPNLHQQIFGGWKIKENPPFMNSRYSYTEIVPAVSFLKGHTFYLFDLDVDAKKKLRQIVFDHDGDISNVCSSCTIAVAPDSIIEDAEELEQFKSQFDSDCLIVREDFLQHASYSESLNDLPFFVL